MRTGDDIFEQLPEWHSKISLRLAIISAIGFGFAAGMACGILMLTWVRLHTANLEVMLNMVFALALAVRFYFLAMSRARAQYSPNQG